MRNLVPQSEAWGSWAQEYERNDARLRGPAPQPQKTTEERIVSIISELRHYYERTNGCPPREESYLHNDLAAFIDSL